MVFVEAVQIFDTTITSIYFMYFEKKDLVNKVRRHSYTKVEEDSSQADKNEEREELLKKTPEASVEMANGIVKEILSLLYWTMLAACTVGPGTVVTCARAGAEFQLNLIWALIFASLLAYTLQEGTARLTITSGMSLGQCIQAKYKHGRLVWGVGVICWVVAGSVFFGKFSNLFNYRLL